MAKEKRTISERIHPKIWDAHYHLLRSNFKIIKEFAELTSSATAKILDIGCGYCPFKSLFRFREYMGVDFDSNSSSADIVLDCGKDRIPKKDSYYDAIILSQVLEHVLDIEHILSEVRRLLKPGGFLYIGTPFLFCEHGVPHDYYRFTRNFYKEKFTDFAIIHMKLGGSFLSAPLIVLNQLVEHLPISILRHPIYVLNNVLITVIESSAKMLYRALKSEKKDGIQRAYGVIALILKKQGIEKKGGQLS